MDANRWYADALPFTGGPHRTVARHEGEGPSLVCLHGFPTSSWDFAPLWPALTARFRCLASDLVGLGRAAKPAHPLTVSMQADVIEALCVARDVTEAAMLAHDLGDTVGQELLARQAEGRARVRWTRVVFLNGGLFPETHRPRLIQKLLASPLGPWVARLSTERTFRRSMTGVFGPNTPPSDEFLRDSWALLESHGGRHSLPYLIRYIEERSVHRERWVQPLVDAIVPMRLVNGTLDPVSGGHAVDRYEVLVPGADTVRLHHLGHYPHVEDPEATLAAIMPFLVES